MIIQQAKDIITPELSKGAIINNEFPGFKQDYLVLHCLLRTYKPKTVFEIGTNFGTGTNIICNAVPNALVYSLDMPFGEGDAPLYDGGIDRVGWNCKWPFTLYRGDSMTFDYSIAPCEFYYIDAGHFYENVLSETKAVCDLLPKVIAYHDTDIPEVLQAIKDGMTSDYELYRVEDTRISYLLRK